MLRLFDILQKPLAAFYEKYSAKIDKESDSRKLYFESFSRLLFYAFLHGVDSLRMLELDLKTKSLCKELGLGEVPFSTLKDGFSRFNWRYFEQLYQHILAGFDWAAVKGLKELGTFCAVDGSLFPVLIQQKWTEYKETANSCKLHLCFELNRMIATDLWVGSGTLSERNFLISTAKAGITYLADKGYFSFALAEKLHLKGAFFVLRIKSNILFTVQKSLEITHSVPMPKCFEKISDKIITFNNDKAGIQYRLICFNIGTKYFRICTNRLDLNTLQIIMLYAFRWQIELMFKFIKRTMNGIHLFNQTQNGVYIQIYSILILALLQIRLKQTCQRIYAQKQVEIDNNLQNVNNIELFISYFEYNPGTFIKNIAKVFYLSWKISKTFIQYLKNYSNQIIDFQLIKDLALH